MPALERGPARPSRNIVNPELSTKRARYVRIDARRAPFRRTSFVERGIPAKQNSQRKPTEFAYFTEKLTQLRRNPRYTPEQIDIFVARTLTKQQRQAERSQKKEKEARKNSERDPLTNLYNRDGITKRFEGVLSWSERTGEPISIAIADIDHFKDINDRYGHAAGDDVLRHTAKSLRDSGRHHDILGRHGGEEFIGILPGTTNSQAVGAMERQRRDLPETVDKRINEGRKFKLDRDVTMSVGVATYDRRIYEERFGTQAEQLRRILIKDGRNLADMAKMDPKERVAILRDAEQKRKHTILEYVTNQADRAMYQAKHAGRDKVFTATEDINGNEKIVNANTLTTPPVYDRMGA